MKLSQSPLLRLSLGPSWSIRLILMAPIVCVCGRELSGSCKFGGGGFWCFLCVPSLFCFCPLRNLAACVVAGDRMQLGLIAISGGFRTAAPEQPHTRTWFLNTTCPITLTKHREIFSIIPSSQNKQWHHPWIRLTCYCLPTDTA